MWLARDKDGCLVLHRSKPYLSTSGMWLSDSSNMILDKNLCPEVTFEDSPKSFIFKII